MRRYASGGFSYADLHEPEVGPNGLGIVSFFGLTSIITAVAWHCGSFKTVLSELPLLLSGRALELGKNGDPFGTTLAVIVLCILACIGPYVVAVKVGKHGEHAFDGAFATAMPGTMFGGSLVVVLVEELLAREFCLGLLTKIPELSGPFGFYLLFVVGNSIWSIIHLKHYSDRRDRQLWRIIPQFLNGVLYTYMYTKYGLLMSVTVHMGFVSLLLSLFKIDRVGAKDVFITGYAAVVGIMAFWLLTKPLSDLSILFQDSKQILSIPGWHAGDYILAHICVAMFMQALFGLLLFDRMTPVVEVPYEEQSRKSSIRGFLVEIAFCSMLLFGFFWAAGYLSDDEHIRALAAAALCVSLSTGRSGSYVARTFWCSVPSILFALFVMQALGFWWAPILILVEYALSVPVEIFARLQTA